MSAAIILKITKGERTEEFDAIVWTLKISKRFLFSDELENADALIKMPRIHDKIRLLWNRNNRIYDDGITAEPIAATREGFLKVAVWS